MGEDSRFLRRYPVAEGFDDPWTAWMLRRGGGAREGGDGSEGGAERREGEEEQRVADGCRPRIGGKGGMDECWEEVCGAVVVVSGGEAGQ